MHKNAVCPLFVGLSPTKYWARIVATTVRALFIVMADISKERLIALRSEIKMSRKVIEEELQPIMRESLSRYIGDYVPTFGQDWDIILNEVYPIIQNHLPSIFFRNPRVFLKPRNPTFISRRRDPITGNMENIQLDSQKSATTQESILNYLLTQIGYKKEVRKVLIDALLYPFGILWHGYKGDFGMTEEQSIMIQNDRIFVQRISPFRFIKDPSVSYSDIDNAQWIGREIDIRLRDVVEDKSFDVDDKLVKGFKAFGDMVGTQSMKNQGADKVNLAVSGRPLIDFTGKEFQESSSSKFVRIQEIFLRPTKKERREGKGGKILILTDEQQKPLRESDWRIKAEGWPAHILEFNAVNDRMFGIPDVNTYKQIADQKNVITNLQIRNAQENTKVWVGINSDGTNEEDVQKIQQGENTILVFEGDKPIGQRMSVSSPGGQASSELYLIDQRIQRNLEDKSGVTDLKKGFLQSGEESATSVKIRNAGGAARPAYRQDIMADFLSDSALYLNQLNKQFMSVKDAVRTVGSLDIEWSENPSKEELQADVDVEIDVVSMLPENPEKELQEFTQALTLMIDGIRDPAIAQKIQEEGKVLNLSPLIEQILVRLKIRDPDIFRNIKPEESEGFVSIREMREAKENIGAAISGQQIPFPPTPEDDHVAKIESYSTAFGILQAVGQVNESLQQLIQVHTALLQEFQSKQPQTGQKVNLSKPTTRTGVTA